MDISIVGAHNTQFGAFVKRDRESGTVEDLKSFYELIVEAGVGAIADAGLEASDISRGPTRAQSMGMSTSNVLAAARSQSATATVSTQSPNIGPFGSATGYVRPVPSLGAGAPRARQSECGPPAPATRWCLWRTATSC